MRNWAILFGLLTLGTGCAAEAGSEEYGSESDEVAGDVRASEQMKKSAAQIAIEAKADTVDWLGKITDNYKEYNGGARINYEVGSVLYNNAVKRAHVMTWDQYNLWTWIGKGSFGWPTADNYTPTTYTDRRIVRVANGYIITRNLKGQAWPVMTKELGSIRVTGGDYGDRLVSVDSGYIVNNQTQTNFTATGKGFPPKTSITVGLSHPANQGPTVSAKTTASGTFEVEFKGIPYSSVGSYNGIQTVWAKTDSNEHAAAWSGRIIPANTGAPAQNYF